MTEHIKKEIISLLKWSILICLAAFAYYSVIPKYELFNRVTRINRITGEAREIYSVDKTGKFVFEAPVNE